MWKMSKQNRPWVSWRIRVGYAPGLHSKSFNVDYCAPLPDSRSEGVRREEAACAFILYCCKTGDGFAKSVDSADCESSFGFESASEVDERTILFPLVSYEDPGKLNVSEAEYLFLAKLTMCMRRGHNILSRRSIN
jgi:hypothetical protein